MKKNKPEEVEKTYTRKQFVEKLRRFADAIEKEENFKIQIAGIKLNIPKDALFNIELEQEKGENEIEFQLKWKDKK